VYLAKIVNKKIIISLASRAWLNEYDRKHKAKI
jgi:hypothetical protein